VGTGSALVIRYASGPDGFRLVTARHVIAQARAAKATIYLEIIRATHSIETFPICAVPIEDEAWALSEDDDVAVATLPADELPEDHLVGSVMLEQLAKVGQNPTPDVQLIGRWGLTKEENFVITRRGILATPQQPAVSFSIGDDKERQSKPMYVVDAFVTRGMSGGAVFSDTQPRTVLGIISAHATLPSPAEKWRNLPETVQRAAEALWEAMAPINAGLVYVVPIARALKFLIKTYPPPVPAPKDLVQSNIETADRIRNWDKPPPA